MTSPYAITITDPKEGRFVDVNEAFSTITDYTREEAVSSSSVALNLWADVEDRNHVVQELLGGRKVVGQEFKFKKKNGDIITGLFSAEFITLKTGRFILSSINDISDRKKAEAALLESQELFHAVLNHAPITIFATDNKGVFTLHEGSGMLRIGMSPKENVGLSAFDLFHSLPVIEPAGKVTNGEDVIRRVLSGETVVGITELKDVFFDNYFTPLLDRQGHVAGLVGVATDITEHKQTEDALRRNLDELRRWQAIMLDREGRVIELKREVNGLLRELGRPEKFAD